VGGDLLKGLLVDTLKLDAATGSDHVASVHSAKRNTVDLERTGDQKHTLGQVLEEDHSLSAEATSEEDKDSTRLEAFPRLGGVDGLANLLGRKSVSLSRQ
jgi:hypothetical protein